MAIVCNCGKMAKLVTSEKGNAYHKCQLGKKGGGCDFFQFVDGGNGGGNGRQNNNGGQQNAKRKWNGNNNGGNFNKKPAYNNNNRPQYNNDNYSEEPMDENSTAQESQNQNMQGQNEEETRNMERQTMLKLIMEKNEKLEEKVEVFRAVQGLVLEIQETLEELRKEIGEIKKSLQPKN
jgi:hypothetical protein